MEGKINARGMPPLTSHTVVVSPAQVQLLKTTLEEQGFDFSAKPYTIFAASKGKLQIAVYEKGPKILIQGKETEEFIQFTLEPLILGEARLGYEVVTNPEMYEPHLGIDESGKGDFFGPLVIAGVYVDRRLATVYREAGVADSKTIGSDQKIRRLAKIIKETQGSVFQVLSIGPEKYNALYKQFRNLNRLLAWGHAKTIELLLEARPDCPRALSDQFANPVLIKRALQERGQKIVLEQRTKAESDIAVAAASVLARERFIDWLETASKRLNIRLPRGASGAVQEAAKAIVSAQGRDALEKSAKMHFKTASQVLGLKEGHEEPDEAAQDGIPET